MFAQDEERDEDRDEEQEDADLDDENSEDEEQDSDDNEESDDDSDDDSDGDDDEDDDDKPVTKKELREMLRKNGNRNNAKRRVNPRDKNRSNSRSPKTEERLSDIEKFKAKAELNEKKREFGYENNLSPKQVDIVFKMTKRPTKKFLGEGYVKAALDAVTAESNVRENTPSGSGRTFKSNSGKTWDKMDANEKQDNLADRRRSILAAKK